METIHFLYLAAPPRSTFVFDATPEEYEILNRHFAFMDEVRKRGQLLLTGPALDGFGGVAIFKVTELAEAQALVASDPAIIAGLFTATLHPLCVEEVTP